MEDATLALTAARGRIAVGAAAVVAPRLVTRLMAGKVKPHSIAPVFARMLGARDMALGLGTVIALDRGKPVRGWLEGSALADTVDCIASLLARDAMSPLAARATASIGAASAGLAVFLARRLDPPPATPGQPEAVATG